MTPDDEADYLYADACRNQVYGEIENVWNTVGGHERVSEYHSADTVFDTTFHPGDIDLSMNREEYRLFTEVGHEFTDHLYIHPLQVNYHGTDEAGHGQTTADWEMDAEINGVTLHFTGTGHHRWTPQEDGYLPRTVHNEIEWGIDYQETAPKALRQMRGLFR